jgi:hypothetical protein
MEKERHMSFNKKALGRLLVLTICVLSMMGCARSKLVQSWHEPAFQDKPLGKILVLGVFKNDLDRRLYEDGVVMALEKGKRQAVTGYSLMPNPSDYDEKEEIIAAVQKTNADAVLIATLKGVGKEEKYTPPRVSYEPTMGFGHGMYDYYTVSYNRVVTPGYTVTNTIVRLEATVFSVKTEKMVWAGATRSVNPESRKRLVKETTGLIVDDMKKAGFL